LHVLNFITRGDEWTKRRKGVQALAPRPLAVAELQVACADIVDERITKNMIERSGFAITAAAYSDDAFSAQYVLTKL